MQEQCSGYNQLSFIIGGRVENNTANTHVYPSSHVPWEPSVQYKADTEKETLLLAAERITGRDCIDKK